MAEETKEFMIDYYESQSNRIKEGKDYVLYLMYCKCCHFRRILASPPIGPGGTLSCPLCKERKENGPHIESSWGLVKTKQITIKLTKEVEPIDQQNDYTKLRDNGGK